VWESGKGKRDDRNRSAPVACSISGKEGHTERKQRISYDVVPAVPLSVLVLPRGEGCMSHRDSRINLGSTSGERGVKGDEKVSLKEGVFMGSGRQER
jgi:hypothetical protein